MYKIFATKSNGPYRPNYETLVPIECQQRDQAAKRCIFLLRGGYTVHKIVLPSGSEIPGNDIEAAMLSAIHFQTALAGRL